MIKRVVIALFLFPIALIAQNGNFELNCFKKCDCEEAYEKIHNRDNWASYIDDGELNKIDSVYYVFRFYQEHHAPIPQESFLNGTFLNSLNVRYFKDCKELPFNAVKIFLPCDSLGWLMNDKIHSRTQFGSTYDQYLLNLLRFEMLDCIFETYTFYREGSGCSGLENMFWGIKGDQLYVIYLFNCIPIEEFLEWGYDFMAGNTKEYPKQLEEMYNRAKALYPSY